MLKLFALRELVEGHIVIKYLINNIYVFSTGLE